MRLVIQLVEPELASLIKNAEMLDEGLRTADYCIRGRHTISIEATSGTVLAAFGAA